MLSGKFLSDSFEQPLSHLIDLCRGVEAAKLISELFTNWEMEITCRVNNRYHENTLHCEFEGDAVVVAEGLHLEDNDQIKIEYGEQKERKTVDPIEVVVQLFDTHDA